MMPLIQDYQLTEDSMNKKWEALNTFSPLFDVYLKAFFHIFPSYTQQLTNMSIPIPIIPRTYIDTSFNDRYCQVCLWPSEDMMICSGACRKYCCTMCVIQQELRGCQNEFQPRCGMEIVKDWPVRFHCPYDRQLCTVKTYSIYQFWQHCETCKFISSQAKAELKNKRDYRCTKGHRLIFVTDGNFDQIYSQGEHYKTTCSQICGHCKEKILSKSVCLECGIGNDKAVFCINCRPIPCERDRCPVGHNFQHTRRVPSTLICDFCGIWAAKIGKQVYSDRLCNFDICVKCHQRVSQKHPLVPLDNIINEKYDLKLRKQKLQKIKQQLLQKLETKKGTSLQ